MWRIWNDCDGSVVSTELLMVTSVLVAGLASGLTSVRDAVISEFSDVAHSVQELNQSFSYQGSEGHAAMTAGSDYIDRFDPTATTAESCIVMNEIP